MVDTNWSEHYIKRGDPSKPTYYIIRHSDPFVGLFAIFCIVAGHIRHSLARGWLPVVDMQNYPNAYLAPEKLGKENSWEYYFEQPLRISLEDAYNGENVILCTTFLDEIEVTVGGDINYFENRNNILTEWRMLIKLGLLKVKPALMEEISAVHKKLFAPNERVLGVILRGTDYVARRPEGHPIPPPVELAASVILTKLAEWNCDKFFLATEDKNIINVFKKNFGDLCVILDREYVDYIPGQAIAACRIDRPNDHYLQGKDYLTQVMLLTMCNSIIAVRTAAASTVMFMPNKFEHTHFFYLGDYGTIDVNNWRC